MDESTPLYYDFLQTGIGGLVLVTGHNGLQHVFFHSKEDGELPALWRHEPAQLKDAVCQLKEYFSGKRQSFDLPLAPIGTSFQTKVWKVLREIPYGVTITYGELAERVGSPKGYRAVGNANGKNPLVILQPCHRVVAGGDKLGGFSAGIHRKKFLLRLEKGEGTLF
jgi:methylated-DNA-[protein]-cysteine S-methyltransferase